MNFDPDYRRSPWNQSLLAPKNRLPGCSISTLAIAISGVTVIPQAIAWSGPIFPYRFIATVLVFYGAFLLSGLLLRVGFTIIVRRAAHRRSAEAAKVEIGSLAFSAREFEREVARIIEAQTGHTTQVIGGSGDEGVDIRVLKGQKLVGIVQCKYYAPTKTLPPQFIREAATVKRIHSVERAYLVTTARFSDAARQQAKSLGVSLIDGDDLRRAKERMLRSMAE
jgi:restriction system protein